MKDNDPARGVVAASYRRSGWLFVFPLYRRGYYRRLFMEAQKPRARILFTVQSESISGERVC